MQLGDLTTHPYHSPFPQQAQRSAYQYSSAEASSSRLPAPSEHLTGLGIQYTGGNRLADILESHDPLGPLQYPSSSRPVSATADPRPSSHTSGGIITDNLTDQRPSSASRPSYLYQNLTPFYPSPLENRVPIFPRANPAADCDFDRALRAQYPPQQRASFTHSLDSPLIYPQSSFSGGFAREVSPRSQHPVSPRSRADHHGQAEAQSLIPFQYPIQQTLSQLPSHTSPHALPPTASTSSFASASQSLGDRRHSDQQSFGQPSPNLGGALNLLYPQTRRDLPLALPSARPSLGAESIHSLRSSPQVYQLPPLPTAGPSLLTWRNSLTGYEPLNPGQAIPSGGVRTLASGHSRNHSGESNWSVNGGYQIPAVPVGSIARVPYDPAHSHNYPTRSRISSLANAQPFQYPAQSDYSLVYGPGPSIARSSPYLPSPIPSPLAYPTSTFPYYENNIDNMPPRRATQTSASASVGIGSSGGGGPPPESYVVPAGPTTRSRQARSNASYGNAQMGHDGLRSSVMSVGSSVQGGGMSGGSTRAIPNGNHGNINGGYGAPNSSNGLASSSRTMSTRGGPIYRPLVDASNPQAGSSTMSNATQSRATRGNPNRSGGRESPISVADEDGDQDAQAGSSTARTGQKRKAVGPGGTSAANKKTRLDSGLELSGQYEQDQGGASTSRRNANGNGHYRGNGTAGTTTSTATQSTLATTVGIAATEQVIAHQNGGANRAQRGLVPVANGHHYTNGNIPNPAQRTNAAALAPGDVAGFGIDGQDDKDGHYVVESGKQFGPGNRYYIMKLLGQGTFGKVIEAREAYTARKVAVKIIRAIQKYREASAIEIRVLQALKRHDPENRNKCIHLLDTFEFRNHICLVSELLGQSVYDFLKGNNFMPFPEKHIQDFAKSLLKSLSYVHSLKLIHTDLKPENILLVENRYSDIGERRAGKKHRHILKNTDIRLIDFGSATWEGENQSTSVVCTRHYRAPEIILGLGWSFPCDLFSIGCILVEFYTGDALFQTHDNLEHLAMMEVVMGKMPVGMANKAVLTEGQFFRGKKLDWPNSQTTKKSQRYVREMRGLNQFIKPDTPLRHAFLDLCKKLLSFDPNRRLTVSQASQHAYLTEMAPEAPTQQDVEANGNTVWGHLRGCPPTIKGRS